MHTEVSRRALLTGSAGGLLLAGCGGAAGARGHNGSGIGVTVTDQRGKKVVLDGPARRIVTFPMPAASMLIAVDKGVDHLVGMNQGSWTAIHGGILGEMFPQAKHIAHGVSGNNFTPNVESVLKLNPDVVIQWGDEGQGIIAPMTNAGLTVVGLTYGTQHDLETWITLFGALLGRQQRAHAMLSRMHTRLQRMKKTAVAASGPRPKIVYFSRFTEGLKVDGHDTYQDFVIRLVGGTNPAHDLTSSNVGVDLEQVLAWDPEIILLSNFDDAMPDDVYGNHVWKDVSAVKHQRVYKVPLGGYRWGPPSHESPLMWRWLYMVAHPTAEPFDLRGAIVSEYRYLYGYEPSSKQIDGILWMNANGVSPDYRQFDAG